MLLSRWHRWLVSSRPHSPVAGFSLIEALVGIAIIGVTAAMIAPIITLSVAARAQNQRVEQGYLIARGHLELVRLRTERGWKGSGEAAYVNDLDVLVPLESGATIADVPAPTAFDFNRFCNLENPTTPVGPPCWVDINNDGQPDFALQAFRFAQQIARSSSGIQVPVSFTFGVRVYPRAVAQRTYTGPLGVVPGQVRLTNTEGVSNPVAVQVSNILKGDLPASLGSMCRTLGGSANCPPQ
jgi:type II secretory pathway pseudopilin PulG